MSEFLKKLLGTIDETNKKSLAELEAAENDESDDTPPTEEDMFTARRLKFAVEVIAAIKNGNSPWLASGPTEEDKGWAAEYFKQHRAKKLRPPHPDANVEEMIQNIVM